MSRHRKPIVLRRSNDSSSRSIARNRTSMLAGGFLLAAICLSLMLQPGQASAQPPIDSTAPRQSQDLPEGTVSVVTADRVMLRCGAAETYYPIGQAERGQMLLVVGEKFNWAKVAAVGPVFDNIFGYIKYPKNQTGSFRLDANGKSGRAMGRLKVLGPSFNNQNDPNHSWRPIAHLAANDTVTIVETKQVDDNIVHTVILPHAATGWVNKQQLATASAAQKTAWTKSLTAPRAGKGATKADASNANRVGDQAGNQAPPDTGLATTESRLLDAHQSADAASNQADTSAAGDATRALGKEEPDGVPVVSGKNLDTLTYPDGTVRQRTDAGGENTLTMGGVNPRTDLQAASVSADLQAGNTAKIDLKARLEKLEDSLKRLADEPLEDAEVLPLRTMFLDLAALADDEERPKLAAFAQARAEQLQIWADLQKRKQSLRSLRTKIDEAGEDVRIVAEALNATGSYAAVGRLAASTIFDGKRLPKLLRLQDPGTGRTVAYLKPGEDYELPSMLGRLIGIVGDKQFDPALRLNVITPRRIDLLGPAGQATVIAETTDNID